MEDLSCRTLTPEKNAGLRPHCDVLYQATYVTLALVLSSRQIFTKPQRHTISNGRREQSLNYKDDVFLSHLYHLYFLF
jgi:hypothetical protein